MREMIVTQAVVFAVEAYREMRRQFDACKAEGRPLVALLKGVPVHANPFHGVRGGWAVDLCIWYIDAPRSWLEAVPQTAEVIKPVESEVPIIPAFGAPTSPSRHISATPRLAPRPPPLTHPLSSRPLRRPLGQ